ncbi:MAG: tetratricopeptide repeat protein [Acidobacteriota bacterium]|nr:tetratricopeptide repeat protein [Acidobacteriota bacterium]
MIRAESSKRGLRSDPLATGADGTDRSGCSEKDRSARAAGSKIPPGTKPHLAIPVLQQIVSLDGRNINAQANLGVLLFFQNQYAEAIPCLRAALELQPDLWRIEALLGISEKRRGDPKAAQNDLERAFANLTDPKIRIETGLELMELHAASSQFGKALTIALNLEELSPRNPQIPVRRV